MFWRKLGLGSNIRSLISGLVFVAGSAISISAEGAESSGCGSILREWSSIERDAWKSLCKTGEFSWDKPTGYNCPYPNGCGLNKRFLRTIFSKKIYRDALPHKLITITGAHFPNGIDLSNLKLDRSIRLASIVSKDGANFHGMQSSHSVYLEQSSFSGTVDIASARIQGDLSIEGSTFNSIDISFSRVGGSIWLSGCRHAARPKSSKTWVQNDLNVSFTRVGGTICAHSGWFGEVSMAGAEVNGQVVLGSAHFQNLVDLYSVKIRSELVLACSVFLDGVGLQRAEIDGWVLLAGSYINGTADFSAARVDGRLALSSSRTRTTYWADDHGLMAELQKPDPISCIKHIRKVFSWAVSPALREAKLVLRDATFYAVQDNPNAKPSPWPASRDVHGFSYTRFVDVDSQENADDQDSGPKTRSLAWYKKWLKESEYTPHQYSQISKIFAESGRIDWSNAIKVAAKDRELELAIENNRWGAAAWLFSFRTIVGYGIGGGPFRACVPLLLMIFVGAAVLAKSRTYANKSFQWRILFSADLILPVVQLVRQNYEENLPSKLRVYFALHQLIGYILVFFVIAGLTQISSGNSG